jgi:NADH-quinone oxidoreductase subunit I
MATHPVNEAKKTELEVVSVSDRNPRVRTVRVARPEPEEASFLPAALKGLSITLRHFFKNVARAVPGVESEIETIEYPEEPQVYPPRNRGLHRLMLREDGRVRCVACMCCPTVCPAHCITIIPAETDDAGVEKYPAVFEIDELRCVVCGLCVEACPCDAIRMDTGKHAASVATRAEGVLGKENLLSLGGQSLAVQGGAGVEWRKTEPDLPYQPHDPNRKS